MKYLFVVTELSAPRLVLAAVLGRDIQIIETEPFLPFTRRLLDKLVNIVVRTGRATRAIENLPSLKRLQAIPRRSLLYDILGQTESWQNNFFHLIKNEGKLSQYYMANKQAVSNYMEGKHVALVILQELLNNEKQDIYRCLGFPADTLAAGKYLCGDKLTGSFAQVPCRLVNFLQSVTAIVISLWWIFSHLRFTDTQTKDIYFAADYIGDEREILLFKELEEGGEMLMVARLPNLTDLIEKQLPGYEFCTYGDGWVDLNNLYLMVKMVVLDELRVFAKFKEVYPPLFRRFLALPYRRLLYRGLFLKFKPKVFWGRDQYSEDHIIRRQELNRIGSQSWGVNTGTLNWSIMLPSNHYVSYDRYYVFGRGKYEKYYGHTWAKDMELIPAGTFSASREHYARRFIKRPNDIAIFTGVFIGEPEFVDLIRGLARAFPDRKVIIQVKPQFQKFDWTAKFIDQCRDGLENIEHTSDSVYDVFFKAKYGISDPSSVIAEAMQFGMISFAFDIPKVQLANVDREYPRLIVQSTHDAVERIRSIEAGSWHYPITEFQDIVDMSGMVFYDRIRRDMGLPAKEISIPL